MGRVEIKMMKDIYTEILAESKEIINSSLSLNTKLINICEIIHNKMEYYHWVGFYLVSREDKLILGPYSGESTEHKEIKFGEGICGQAAKEERTFIIDNVLLEENYLSCSSKVKSEIVVPVYKNGKITAEIDIDSHEESAFKDSDKNFLEKLSEMLSEVF